MLDPDRDDLADAQRFRDTEPKASARHFKEDDRVLDASGIDENCRTPKVDPRGAFARPREVFDGRSPAIFILTWIRTIPKRFELHGARLEAEPLARLQIHRIYVDAHLPACVSNFV